MHSATDPTYVDGIEFDALALPPCFDRVTLAIQIKQLKDFLAASGNSEEGSTAVAEISYLLWSKDRVTQILFSEVLRLASLCLCQPCSNASSERAFWTLRRLKIWLRNTMGQKRLTHLGLMATNIDILLNLDSNKLMNDFIYRTPERRSVFGCF